MKNQEEVLEKVRGLEERNSTNFLLFFLGMMAVFYSSLTVLFVGLTLEYNLGWERFSLEIIVFSSLFIIFGAAFVKKLYSPIENKNE